MRVFVEDRIAPKMAGWLVATASCLVSGATSFWLATPNDISGPMDAESSGLVLGAPMMLATTLAAKSGLSLAGASPPSRGWFWISSGTLVMLTLSYCVWISPPRDGRNDGDYVAAHTACYWVVAGSALFMIVHGMSWLRERRR